MIHVSRMMPLDQRCTKQREPKKRTPILKYDLFFNDLAIIIKPRRTAMIRIFLITLLLLQLLLLPVALSLATRASDGLGTSNDVPDESNPRLTRGLYDNQEKNNLFSLRLLNGDDDNNTDDPPPDNDTDHDGDTGGSNDGDNDGSGNDQEDDGDHDDDGVDDEIESEEEREETYEYGDDYLQIESSNPRTGDTIEFKVELEDVLVFKLSQESDGEANNAFEVTWKLYSLAEIQGDTIENNTQPVIINEIGFDEFEWTFVEKVVETGLDNDTVTTFTWRTVDGRITIKVSTSTTYTRLEGLTLRPSTLKISLFLNNMTPSSSSSLIALKSTIETSFENFNLTPDTVDEYNGLSSNEDGINFNDGNSTFYFNWKREVLVDNSTKPVVLIIASENYEEKRLQLFHVLGNGENFSWDPTLGKWSNLTQIISDLIPSLATLVGANDAIYGTSGLVILGVFFVMVVLKGRRKRDELGY